MRRPHVYERTAPRARRDVERKCRVDYGDAARAVLDAVPALLLEAEASGAVALARFLGQALTEAEGIMRRAPAVASHDALSHATSMTKADDERQG